MYPNKEELEIRKQIIHTSINAFNAELKEIQIKLERLNAEDKIISDLMDLLKEEKQ
jgi:predicted DNA-binding protein YlxM (UPF0122 family)